MRPAWQITAKLALEHGLRLEAEGVKLAGGFRGRTVAERESSLVQVLEKLSPGRWLLVAHPGLDMPEMRGLGHKGYEYVAEERTAVTAAFTSPKVLYIVKRRRIRLISFADLR